MIINKQTAMSIKKQLSMQMTGPSGMNKADMYVSKVDGRRMIKRVITENLKRSKSKQTQLDASTLAL